MAEEHFRHLFISESQTRGFTSPQAGGPAFGLPPRIRATHAEYLTNRLNAAWQAAQGRQAVAHVERHGCYLEFAGSPGFDLMLKGLEDLRSGIRLLNVRTVIENDQERMLATVYIPSKKSAYFLQKIRAYQTEETARTRNPKNKNLIESIEDVRDALLETFWTDKPDFIPRENPFWVEVWLSSTTDDVIRRFRQVLPGLGISEHEHHPLIRFPERAVLLIQANRAQLIEMMERTDDLAELRSAQATASFFIEMENKDQVAWVNDLLSRTDVERDSKVAVCILDHGINRGHPLLTLLRAESDLHTVRDEWGKQDHDGHGTLMAGTVAYGDVQRALESKDRVQVSHLLESAKILPPPSAGQNPRHLWGEMTAQGISRAEIQAPDRRRVICMAVTAEETRDNGHPSSWSGEVDQLAAGVDSDTKRLILVSAGNIRDSAEWGRYPDSNLTNEVHDPAQAWNALTVGAFTNKTRIDDPKLAGYSAIAEAGGLSPFSTTSLAWSRRWPIKPEVVLEGGNAARGPNGSVLNPDDLRLLSTFHDPQTALLSAFDATSAATAQAAWMGAMIQAAYPDAWPETIRGLLVHSADWTETMKRQFLRDESKNSYGNLLRTCGYGVPDLSKALYCLRNLLTLISQAELQPFKKKTEGGYATKDMHIYRLPWPRDILLGLEEVPVVMRVTLSYFVEPGPGEIGWEDRYRYASHGLRFELNSPLENEREFVQRINRQDWDEDEGRPDTDGPANFWKLGRSRNVGSIHSDIWTGTAAELAASHLVAVRPSIGWWRERPHLERWGKRCRYSLIVSISTPGQDVDIYTPVAVQIGVPIPIPIEITHT